MKVFHEIAFDGFVNYVRSGVGNDPVQWVYPTSDPRLQELMGAVDTLHVGGYASQVTGTSPTLTILLQSTNDQSIWLDSPASPVINAAPLSTSGETFFQGADDSRTSFKFGYARLAISLGGTNPTGLVRVWVTGRDFSRRARAKPTPHAAQARTTETR